MNRLIVIGVASLIVMATPTFAQTQYHWVDTVKASTDDAGYSLANVFTLNAGSLILGTNASNVGLTNALRFTNGAIPANNATDSVTIDSAFIHWYEVTDAVDSGSSRYSLQLSAAPATFSTTTDFNARSWTTAYTRDTLPYVAAGNWFVTANFATPFQEFVDWASYADSQDVVVRVFYDYKSAGDYNIVAAYDYDPAYAAWIDVWYTVTTYEQMQHHRRRRMSEVNR